MFWENFYELCTSNGKKPAQVVREIGIANGSITKWKNGTMPSSKNLERLAEYFGVDVEYFFVDHEKNKSSDGELVDRNVIKMIGRDGSYTEKLLSDEQMKALKTLINQLPDALDDI